MKGEVKDLKKKNATVATMERVPFDVRVRAKVTRQLTALAPRWLPATVTEDLVFSAVDIALSYIVDTVHMNDSVEYLLDQHRIAHRLPNVPVGARAMFLSRKERILAILISVRATRSMPKPGASVALAFVAPPRL